MYILHAHFSPDNPGLTFWAENADAPTPRPRRGRVAKKPKPQPHPFCLSGKELRHTLAGETRKVTLRLPTVRGIPLPSPQLVHNWELDTENPALAPFVVDGIFFPPEPALSVCLAFASPQRDSSASFCPSPVLRYWSQAASLVLESLAAQQFIPTIAGKQARWQAILDSPRDSARLTRLAESMPPVCRAEASSPTGRGAGDEGDSISPKQLLSSFINTFVDSLIRAWGRNAAPNSSPAETDPAHRWLQALFAPDAALNLTVNQAYSLTSGYQAWMRNLHVAGDAAFRIAFRLEAPALQNQDWRLHYLIQAKNDPSLLIPAGEVWKKTRGVLTHLGHRFEQPQEKLLTGLGYASRLFPPIGDSLKGKCPTELRIDTGGAYTFLRETAPVLEHAGFGILVPPWWNKKGARLGVKVKMTSRNEKGVPGRMTLDNLVRYQWQLSVGETELSEAEFRALADLKSPLVQIRGQWVSLDAEQIAAAIHFWEKQQLEGEMGLLEAVRIGLGGEAQVGGLPMDGVDADDWLCDWLEKFSQPARLEVLPPPAGLIAQLRPYQEYGYSWLSFLRRWGMGACLADDMGLGKTIQTIAWLLREKEERTDVSARSPALLIAPTSVVTNWEREIARFAPGLQPYVHRGADRLKGGAFHEAIAGRDVVLTSYPVARLDAGSLQSIQWSALILDEAQNIKNPDAKQTQVIRKLDADFRIALTGTLVENRLSELWSIMHFLNPGYLGARKAFREKFALPIERYQDTTALDQLKALTTPFILRRVKTDPRVLTELPEKVETRVYVTLTEEQATLYETVVQDVMQEIESGEGVRRRGLVLSMLMQLKQICNHPDQYLGKDGFSEVESGKFTRLREICETVYEKREKALVFTQFREIAEPLKDYLETVFGHKGLVFHGGTPVKKRREIIESFQNGSEYIPFMVLSIKAGGFGLNLAFRIGQKKNVLVHKFIARGTLEEKIDAMLEEKKGLSDEIIRSSGEEWITGMSNERLMNLFTLSL